MISMFLILSNKLNNSINTHDVIGIIGLFVSIITHISVILYLKKKDNNVHAYLLKQYGFALLILIFIYYITNGTNLQMKHEYLPIFIYSLIIGYIGFYFNFYSIKNLNSFKISILEFLSIAISFIIGYILFNEEVSILQWTGVLTIIVLNYYSFNFLNK